jgi:hypothetical protein
MTGGFEMYRFIAGALAAYALGTASAWALNEGKTAQGEPFVMGGLEEGDRFSMRQDRKKFSLWVQTSTTAAATASYLSDASVKITTRKGNTVLDMHLTGPWLLVNLGAGEYSVAVSSRGRTQTRHTVIHNGDHNEMLFYFDEPLGARPAAVSR